MEEVKYSIPDYPDELDGIDNDESDELQHWGIKGQKWGVRRFQNKDGSLTPQGRKRYGSLEEAVGALNAARIKAKRKKQLKKARAAAAEKRKADEEARAAAEQRAKDVADGKISARNMTSEELQSRIDKLNLEKRYKQLMQETSPSANTVNAGKSLAKKMWDEAVVPATVNAGKEILGNYLKDQAKKQFGIKDSEMDALKKEFDKLDIKQKISNAKKNIYDNERHLSGEDVDDKMPSYEDRAKILKNPGMISEAEKERFKRQGWYNDGSDSSSSSSNSSNQNTSSSNDSNTSSNSSNSSSNTNSSSSLTVPGADTPINSKQFEANAEVGIRTYNELKDKYGSHIMYMSDTDQEELYHWGIKGQKWGVRRFQNKDGGLTPAGKKRYGEGGKVYVNSGKVKSTDGKDFYVANAGTKNAKGGGNVGNIYGKGDTRKEAVRNAEHELVKYLDNKNDLHYESKSTEKLRNKTQKQNFKDLKKASLAKGEKQADILNNNSDIQDAVAKVKKSREKWFKSEEELYRVRDKIAKDIDYDKKVTEEFNRRIDNYKKNGYRDDYIDRNDIREHAMDVVFRKYIKDTPEFRKAYETHNKNVSDYHNELENAVNTVLGKYGNRPITTGDSLRSRTTTAEFELDRYLKLNTL